MSFHALVIGVDRYPGLSEQEQLGGCVNDAEAVRRFLVERAAIPEENLLCLTSPNDTAPATAANIRAAFAALAQGGRVQPGDHVVLFYAGHGVRLARASAGGAERHYGFAAADLDRTAAGLRSLILDREIHDLLRALQQRGATATVIADTCHSGGALRAAPGEGATVRERCASLRPLDEVTWGAVTAAHPALASARDPVSVGRFGEYRGGDFVALCAARDTETAKEDTAALIADDGTPQRVRHGVLTIHLLEELSRVRPEDVASLRWMDFFERLRDAVARRVAGMIGVGPQTPTLEGRRETPVLGGAWRPFAPGFSVRVGAGGLLRVDGGRFHGLDEGAVLAVHPPSTVDFEDPNHPGVEAVIDSADAMISTAHLLDPAKTVADRSRARIVRPSPREEPIVVRVVGDPARLPPAIAEAAAAGPNDARWFRLTLAGEDATGPAHAELRPWRGEIPPTAWDEEAAAIFQGARDGWVLVATERFGEPTARTIADPAAEQIIAYLPGAGPPVVDLADAHRGLGRALGKGLSSWARCLRARDRRSLDGALAGVLSVKLRAGRGSPDETIAPLEPEDGVYTVFEDGWILVEVRILKSTSLRLYLGYLGFSDDGAIDVYWPPEGETPTYSRGDVLHLGFDRFSPLQLTPRGDQRESGWTLKIVACTAPAGADPPNLRSLEQRPVHAVIAESLLGELRPRAGPTRGSRKWVGPAEKPAWYAWDLRVVTRRWRSP